MKIRVLLEREYEIDCTLDDMEFDSAEDISGMEEVDFIEKEAAVITTRLVEGSVKIIEV